MKKVQQPSSAKMIMAELDPGGYHIFVNLKVNGKKCRFLIDTGASKSVIDKVYYDKHLNKKKLKKIQQETTGLHSSVSETHIGTIKEIDLGKSKIKNYPVAAIDLSHVNNTYKKLRQPKIQGILGSDLMYKYRMVIDYGKEKIFLFNPKD
ncbi:MAG: retropepsin-like domain-containing protein [Chitinophagales bacterium]|nr:retropepsin-like domain-containing protein [Chitinophagales bacterium]